MSTESATRCAVRRAGQAWAVILETRTAGIATIRTRLATVGGEAGARASVARAEAEAMLAHAAALEAEGRA
jgi:hypothetical protein